MPSYYLSNTGTFILMCGLYNLGFAAFHICFWILFKWPASLRPSGTVNTAITQTLNIVLTYCFAVYGGALIWAGICAAQTAPLLLFAGGGFWLLRTCLQPLLFPMRNGPSMWITVVFLIGALLHFTAFATWPLEAKT